MNQNITYVGLDVHKKTIQVAMLNPGEDKRVEWGTGNTEQNVAKMAKKLKELSGGCLKVCYEAGPTGYTLQRQLRSLGIDCVVVAPSLIPVKPGERIKTDRRDALKLAEVHRAQMHTEVHPPTPQDEALRDLCRCREDAVEDLRRCKNRLEKMLLRQGKIFNDTKTAWSMAYREWLKTVTFEHRPAQIVFEQYCLAVDHLEEQIKSLVAALEEAANTEPYREPIARLRCFRGIDLITAITLVAELHGFQRFTSPRQLMSYLGLVPSEDSSGQREHRGSITKMGNSHARRILVEAAWNYQHGPRISAALRKRREGQSPRIVAIADKAQQRLCRRFTKLAAARKPTCKVVVAVARELTGFVWAALTTTASAIAPIGTNSDNTVAKPIKPNVKVYPLKNHSSRTAST